MKLFFVLFVTLLLGLASCDEQVKIDGAKLEDVTNNDVKIDAVETITEQVEKPVEVKEASVDEQAAEKPVEPSVVEEPVVEKPVAVEPIAAEPVAEEPVAEEPVAEEPVAEEPAVEEPAVEEQEQTETVEKESADVVTEPEVNESENVAEAAGEEKEGNKITSTVEELMETTMDYLENLMERFGEKPVVATVFLAYLISMIILFKNFTGGKKNV